MGKRGQLIASSNMLISLFWCYIPTQRNSTPEPQKSSESISDHKRANMHRRLADKFHGATQPPYIHKL